MTYKDKLVEGWMDKLNYQGTLVLESKATQLSLQFEALTPYPYKKNMPLQL